MSWQRPCERLGAVECDGRGTWPLDETTPPSPPRPPPSIGTTRPDRRGPVRGLETSVGDSRRPRSVHDLRVAPKPLRFGSFRDFLPLPYTGLETPEAVPDTPHVSPSLDSFPWDPAPSNRSRRFPRSRLGNPNSFLFSSLTRVRPVGANPSGISDQSPSRISGQRVVTVRDRVGERGFSVFPGDSEDGSRTLGR